MIWCTVHNAVASDHTGDCQLAEALLVVKVDGEWPDSAYEKISARLTGIGGTTYWQKPSHRIAYAKVCMDALADVPLSHVSLPGDALAEAQPE